MTNEDKYKEKLDLLFKNRKGFNFYDFVFGRVSREGGPEFIGQSLLKFFPVLVTKRSNIYYLSKEDLENEHNIPYLFVATKGEEGMDWISIDENFILANYE